MGRVMRAETKPTQFGEDWPGVFIRGDDAIRFAHSLRIVLGHLEEEIRRSENVVNALHLQRLADLLLSCHVSSIDPAGIQRLKDWTEVQG